MKAFQDIVAQHFDEASFLWGLRAKAVEQPHYSKADIFDIEQRMDAQLDALTSSSVEQAWDVCLGGLQLADPGDVFTASMVAFKSHEITKIQKVVETALTSEMSTRGLISALGWLPEEVSRPWIDRLLLSKELNHKYLGVAACSVRRFDPAEKLTKLLQRDDCKQHERLYSRAVRLVGELKRLDLHDYLEEINDSDSESINFWSNWSAALIGDKQAVQNLEHFVFQFGVYQKRAIQLVFRMLSVELSRSWISKLMTDTDQMRNVITATGVLGDPLAIDWLIVVMKQPEFSRLAGESFSMITGIDLEMAGLLAGSPEELQSRLKDGTEDAEVSLHEDENLPWPDPTKVALIWQEAATRFTFGQRYFLGEKIASGVVEKNITTLSQRQRDYAALEMATSAPAQRFENVKMKLLNSAEII